MKKKSVFDSNTSIPPELEEIFGPAPVLPTEVRTHQEIFWCFAQAVKPRDIVEWIYIRDLADIRVEIQRLRRLGAHLIVRPCRDAAKQIIRLTHDDEMKASGRILDALEKEVEAEIKKGNYPVEQIEAQKERLREELRPKFEPKLDKIADQTDNDLEFIRRTYTASKYQAERIVFPEWIDNYERVQVLRLAPERLYRQVVRDLEDHRNGLGERLWRADAQIIDHEPNESSISAEKQTLGGESASAACMAASMPTADPSLIPDSPSEVHAVDEQEASIPGSAPSDPAQADPTSDF